MQLGIGANADRFLYFSSEAYIGWDESEQDYIIAPDPHKYTDAVLLETITGELQTIIFDIMKPISAYLIISHNGCGNLWIYQNSKWNELPTIGEQGDPDTLNRYGIQLNPGYYKLTTVAGDPAYTLSLYATGVYGTSAVIAARIVE